jgi:hypothetical protein
MNGIIYYILLLVLIIGILIGYLGRHRLEKTPKVIVWYGAFILPFIFLVAIWYILTIKRWESLVITDRLSFIGQVSGLAFAIGAGFLAFLQFARSANDAQGQKLKSIQQFINSVEKELTEVGWWTGLNSNTGGYKMENQAQWIQDNFRMRVNLGSKVNPLNCSFIEKANLLPGLSELENEKPGLAGLLVGYLFWCKTFNNYLLDIQQFISSHATLDFYKKTSDLTVPVETILLNLTPDEQNFADILFSKYL